MGFARKAALAVLAMGSFVLCALAQQPAVTVATGPLVAPLRDAGGQVCNVLAYGTVKGDGVTDDAPALQAILDANPGRTILFPPGVYRCGATLYPQGDGQELRGSGASWRRDTGTRLEFPAGVTGVDFQSGRCVYGSLRHLTVRGGALFQANTASQAIVPRGPFGAVPRGENAVRWTPEGGPTADGVRVGAPFTRVEDVIVEWFDRNGVSVGDGLCGPGNWGDEFCLTRVTSQNNRGCGFAIMGGDSNAGTTIQCRAYVNQLWGFLDLSFLGNTHISPFTDSNGGDLTAGGQIHALLDAAGVDYGAFRSAPNSVGNTWVGPYAEAGQATNKFSFRDTVIGGDLGTGDAPGYAAYSWYRAGPALPGAITFGYAEDADGLITLRSGRTAAQDSRRQWVDLAGVPYFVEKAGPTGWCLWQGPVGSGARRIWCDQPTGVTRLNSPTAVQIGIDGAGGAQFGDGRGRVALTVDPSGALRLPKLRDADAPRGSFYYSIERARPAWKD